jgi:hypothetical protein
VRGETKDSSPAIVFVSTDQLRCRPPQNDSVEILWLLVIQAIFYYYYIVRVFRYPVIRKKSIYYIN